MWDWAGLDNLCEKIDLFTMWCKQSSVPGVQMRPLAPTGPMILTVAYAEPDIAD